MRPERGRDAMLERLREGGVRDPRVLAAMAAVPREAFVQPADQPDAYVDRALPIGHNQTISQPLMVAIIVEALELRDGDHALDVGTGSGYQAAVMAACGAHVVSVERIPELALGAGERLAALGLDVEVLTGDGSLGAPERAGSSAREAASWSRSAAATRARSSPASGSPAARGSPSRSVRAASCR